MLVIGIDAALAHSGWAVLRDEALLEYGVIETRPNETSEANRMWDLQIQLILLFKKVNDEYIGETDRHLNVAIERTDWGPGSRDDRNAWVREAKARDALGIGYATACLASKNAGVEPLVLGAREWMDEIGVIIQKEVSAKEQTAEIIARLYPAHFKSDVEPIRGSNPTRYHVVARDGKGTRIPDHITDAIAIAHVAMNRLQLESRAVPIN